MILNSEYHRKFEDNEKSQSKVWHKINLIIKRRQIVINVFQKWLHISLRYSIFAVNMVLFFPKQKVAGAKIFTFSMPELEKVIALKIKIVSWDVRLHWLVSFVWVFSVCNQLQKTVWWQIQLDSIRGNLPGNKLFSI